MAKDCPVCGLVNPPEAVWCDCGYEFNTGRVGPSTLSEHDRDVNARNAEAMRPVVPVPGGWRGVLVVLVATFLIHTSNALGLLVGGVSFLTALPIALTGLSTGGFFAAWGAVAVALDFGIRKFVYRAPLLDTRGGSRFVFTPGWVFGVGMWLVGMAIFAVRWSEQS